MNRPQDSFNKLEEAIAQADDLSLEERKQWLAEFCAGDDDLRHEIESFWAAEAEAGAFLEKTIGLYAAALTTNGAKPEPRKFGNYSIITEIGRGGMGAVFLADRTDGEFTHQVAIKIVRQAIAEKELVERFRRERQILASLAHPNIARLLDGGVSEAGEPFLVMEYIDGKPLSEHADAANLNTELRLGLFLKVCRAVSYAHQNLIVHRDIKPSNILVDRSGEPKLLDFGLAKAFDEALPESERTQTTFRALTPAYASPEQLRGVNVTTASDIYSLGVVLYELLTGQRPYEFGSNSLDEILRVVSTRDPIKPSTAVERRARSADSGLSEHRPKPVNVHLKGDLDNIVLMALRKEPERRYRSVDQFAEDIDRFLRNLPVIAREDKFGYRASKFIQRNAVAVVAGSLVAVATVAGAVISRRQAQRADLERERAERRFGELRQLSHSLMFEIHDSVQDLPGSTETRQLIVSRALEYLDSLAKEASDDFALQQELATAYKKVGDIQGNPYSANLGDIDGAMRTYEQARKIYEDLVESDKDSIEARRDLAALYDRIGEIRLHASNTQGGLDAFAQSLAVRQGLLDRKKNDPKARRELAVSLMKMGEGSQKLGDLDVALRYERQALSIFRTLATEQPNDLKCRRDVMLTLTKVGYMLYMSDDLAGALDSYRQSFAITETLAQLQPGNATALRDLSIAHNNIGRILLKSNDADGAEDAFGKSVTVAESLADRDRRNELAMSDVVYGLARLAAAQSLLGKYDQALENARRSLETNKALYRANPRHAFTLAEIAYCYQVIGETFERMGNLTDALTSLRQAVEAREKMTAADSGDAEYLKLLSESYQTLGNLNIKLAHAESDDHQRTRFSDDGRRYFEQALGCLNDLGSRGYLNERDSATASKIREQLARYVSGTRERSRR